MKNSLFSSIPFFSTVYTFAVLLSAIVNAAAQTQCVETNGAKVYFPPNIDNGLDVFDSYTNVGVSVVLADDFFCNTTGAVTDIHLWGSWLSDSHGFITNVWMGIYDDVPAITNLPTGTVVPSHPGTNLLWQQIFGPGEYVESPYGTGSEGFFDPRVPGLIGGDTMAYYYCFYPTNPFVQQGTAAKPTNYWLAVYVKVAGGQPGTYGWKTALTSYNDPAVWGTIQPGTGLPIGDWRSLTNTQTLQPLNLAFKLTTPTNPPPNTCCPDDGGVKWVQRPNTVSGVDIDFFSTHSGGIVLADDFKCTNSGPITDIHLWESWTGDVPDPNQFFTLGIWSDVPAGVTTNYSHPGTLLWTETFTNGQYGICFYTNAPETVYGYIFFPGSLSVYGNTTNLFYLCFHPTTPFPQQGSQASPTNYWLSVYAPLSHWKSSSDAYNDSAVAGFYPGAGWSPIPDPVLGGQLNFAFKITTATNTPTPPVVCVESDFDKYVQGPNIFGGFDVWNTPYVLADDFICTNTGPLSDIHLWGSWLNDVAQTNTINFWLGIYDDVPADSANPFSHPGTNLLWQQWFTPGQYAEAVWTNNAQEQFLDPGQSNSIGNDTVVWYYCFYPTNAFQQTGTSTNAKTYWLAAYAQLPVGANFNYGWKTTTNVQHDASVHATWPGTPPIVNAGWTPTGYQPPAGGPPFALDLAFKLTMCGPVRIQWLPPTNVVVTWPGAGYLQSATNVSGPYVDVPGFPTSPYIDYAVSPTNKFYRLRCY
jgi:hypothetical protein